MATRKLTTRMGLDEEVVRRLSNAGVTNCKELFEQPEPQLMIILDRSPFQVRQLLTQVASRCVPEIRTASTILTARSKQRSFLPTRMPTLDTTLGGGLSRGSLTEVVGPAGVGKSQLCLTMCACAGLPEALGGLGEGTGVLFLDTEQKFSPHRVQEIAKQQAPSWYDEAECSDGPTVAQERLAQLLRQITVLQPEESASLMEQLESVEPLLIESRVGLIVLDSVAALARKDFGVNKGVERSKALVGQAAALKRLADAFDLAVLITNQVTSSVNDSNGGRSIGDQTAQLSAITGTSNAMALPGQRHGPPVSGGGGGLDGKATSSDALIPALGNTWHHCVSTRLVCEQFPSHRTLTVAKSPLAAATTVPFQVTAKGLEELAPYS